MFEKEIYNFTPTCEQERVDREIMLRFIKHNRSDVLLRENAVAHISGSSMVFNAQRTKVLMVYHNIYKSWSWTGGHADGESDMLCLAQREAREETGVKTLEVLSKDLASIDILPVPAHIKNGQYVAPHLHLSLAYLLTAREDEPLQFKPDENSAAEWILISELEERVSEKEMLPLYEKLIAKAKSL